MNLSLAVNEKYTAGGEKKEFVSFFEVTVWGKIGEVLNQYLKKGKQIAVDGKLRQERWNDKEGQSRSKIKVIAENIQLLGGMKQDSGGAPIVPDSVSDSTHDEDDIPF
jgi:single-strand DNA-binding protein